MKIHIVSDETKIRLTFPTRLLTSRLGIRFLLDQSQKHMGSNECINGNGKMEWDETDTKRPSSQDLRRLRKIIKDLKKKHGEFPLVEVESDDGTSVRILL